MIKKIEFITGLTVILVISACAAPQTPPTVAPVSTGAQPADMPNPASVYCEQQGNKLEIRTAVDGSQTGACIFPDGSECDEWAFFRGECGPSGLAPQPTDEIVNGWRTYRNELLGYNFQYPADTEIIIADNPLKSLLIFGPGTGNETWGISHPSDREEYRPPEGVDLSQWLTDHYLLGEKRMPDTQIAGTPAIHFRHERSPQSPAGDRYYFAKAGQLYMVLIEHSSDEEDWDLDNRFLQSIQLDGNTSNASASTVIPTAAPTATPVPTVTLAPMPTALPPLVLDDTWATYTNDRYGFSFRYPSDWKLNEITGSVNTMSGHAVHLLHPTDPAVKMIIAFKRVDEDQRIAPTGMGDGELVSRGSVLVLGQPVERIARAALEKDLAIYYGWPRTAVASADLAYWLALDCACSPADPAAAGLTPEVEQIADAVVESIEVR
jgi:putative hemolysin